LHFDVCANVECSIRIIQKIVQCAIEFEGFFVVKLLQYFVNNCLQLFIFVFSIVYFGIPMVGFCLRMSYAKHPLLLVVRYQSNME
jgi:hypothetical protein